MLKIKAPLSAHAAVFIFLLLIVFAMTICATVDTNVKPKPSKAPSYLVIASVRNIDASTMAEPGPPTPGGTLAKIEIHHCYCGDASGTRFVHFMTGYEQVTAGPVPIHQSYDGTNLLLMSGDLVLVFAGKDVVTVNSHMHCGTADILYEAYFFRGPEGAAADSSLSAHKLRTIAHEIDNNLSYEDGLRCIFAREWSATKYGLREIVNELLERSCCAREERN